MKPIEPEASLMQVMNRTDAMSLRRSCSRNLLAGILSAFALVAAEAPAQSIYWDGGTADITTDGNGASGGGAGTWNITLLNWDAGSSPHLAWNNANNDTAVFGGTAGTVTLGTPVTAGGLQFSVTGYTVTGNTLTLASGASVSVTGDATINSIIAGSSGFMKTGSGRLGLGAANTYSGTTTISTGFVDFTNISLTGFGGGSGRNISVAAGAGVKRNAIDNAFLNRLVETTDDITVMTGSTSGNFDFSSSTGANLPNAFLGNWASNGAKMEYTGKITPASDTYRLGGKGSNGLLAMVGANLLTGSRGLIVGGAGASGIRVMIAGANDFTGDTVINTGAKLTIANNLAIQNSPLNVGASGGNFALNSAGTVTNAVSSASPTFGGLIGSRNLSTVFTNSGGNNESNLASTAVTGFTLNPGVGKTCTYTGVIANFATGTTLTKSGAGTQIFTAAHTYTGATTINGGTLQIGDGGITGSLATSAITNNATLAFNRSNDFTVGQVISGSGNLVKQGAGILTLTATNTYGGDTSVEAGTLKLNNPNSSNETSAVAIAATGATLELNFSGTDTVQSLVIGGTPMANGVYKAISNPAAGIGIAQITGNGTLSVVGDVYPPSFVSFSNNNNSRPIAAGSTLTYTVTFTEDMDAASFSAADFANAGNAPVTIGTITETAPGVFTVQVTPMAEGTVRFQIPAGATLTDVAGNALATLSAITDTAVILVYRPDATSPQLRAVSTVTNSSGTTLGLTTPSGVKPGDLLIANIAQYASGTAAITAPAGWTVVKTNKLGNNASYFGAVYYKLAGVNETGPYAFTLGGGSTTAAGVVLAFSDVDTGGSPFDTTSSALYSGTSATTTVGPAAQVTTVSPNAQVLMLGMAVGTNSVSWSGWSTTSPGALAELYDVTGSGTGNNATSLSAAWALKPATGATGTGSATLSASARNGSILLALKPSRSDALLAALAALKAHVTGAAPLTDAQIAAHKATIVAQQSRFASSATAIAAAFDLVQTYDQVLGPLWVARVLPDRALVTDDLHYTIYTVMQAIEDKTYTSTNIANLSALLNGFAFGSSANFPGPCAPPADPNQVHTAVISGNYLNTFGRSVFGEDSSHPSPKPTGTYLSPGSIATVTVPSSMVGRGYRIRVGAHSWDYSNKPFIKRLDRCSVVYNIVSTETQVANPLGGGIYIEVPPYVSDVGVVNVQIKNAVRSPYFSAKSFHQTTLSEWLNTERLRQAPWADFQSEKFMMQVPTSWIYALPDPVKLIADWDLAVDICNDLMGFPHDRGRETIYEQVDVLIRSGAYAPGYPAVNNTYTPGSSSNGYSNSYLVRGPQYSPDYQFHELGHGYLFPKFPGEVESVVNLLHVPVLQRGFGYSLDEAFRKSRSGPAYATLETTSVAWMMCDNFLNGIAMEGVEKQYQLKGHAKFVEIARMFGWEKLHDHYYGMNADQENGLTVATDVDSLLLRLSRDVGVDIRPLFHFWGVLPISSTSLNNSIQSAKLPTSRRIYDTLVRYKSLIPANNAAFRTFATNWWGRQPLSTGYTEEANHAARWDAYDEAFAATTTNRAQQIISLYFPNGRPSDYGDWTTRWPGVNLINPDADLDGDGMSNNYERIWGLNPTSASSANPVSFNTSQNSGIQNAGQGSGNFTYTRRDPSLTGLNYTVWTSTNLQDWIEDSGAVQAPGTPDSNGIQTVSVTLSSGVLVNPSLFIRMRASE